MSELAIKKHQLEEELRKTTENMNLTEKELEESLIEASIADYG